MTVPQPIVLLMDRLTDEFTAVRKALDSSRSDARDPAAFANLPEVQRLLHTVRPPEPDTQDPTAAGEYLTFMYALYCFWSTGGTVLTASRDALSAVLDGDLLDEYPIVPSGACYVRIPARWFWAQVTAPAPHEPVDGLFCVDGPRGPTLTVLALLGIHPDRTGFSQIAATVHRSDARAAFEALRPDRFAPVMEGGDRAGFRSITSPAELLVLGQLALRAAAR